MGFVMPEFHDRFDDSFCLPVCPGCLDFRKPLLDLLLPAQGHERMMLRISPVLLSVVAVVLFYRIRAFFQDLFQKDRGGILGLVRRDRCVQLPGEIIDGNKQILSSPERCLSLKQGQSLRVTAASVRDNPCCTAWPGPLNGPRWPPRSLTDA